MAYRAGSGDVPDPVETRCLRMSNRSKAELMWEITTRLRAMQVAADLFDDASAELLGVNRTDHRASTSSTRRDR